MMRLLVYISMIVVNSLLLNSLLAQDKILVNSQKELEAMVQKVKAATQKRMEERADFLKEIEVLQKEIAELETQKVTLLKDEKLLNQSVQDSIAGKNRLTAELLDFRQKFELAKTEHNLNRPLSVIGAAGFVKEASADISVSNFFQLLKAEEIITAQSTSMQGSYVNENQQKITGELVILGNMQAYLVSAPASILVLNGSTFVAVKNTPISEQEVSELKQIQPFGVPLDVTGGAALMTPVVHQSVWFRLQDGGVVVYPILLTGAVAILIILFKFLSLAVASGPTLQLETIILRAKNDKNWEEVERLCKGKKALVYQLTCQALEHKKQDKILTDEILEEKIFAFILKLERWMATLNVLGVIAPLLGLLGTVTGMIATFDVISVHGSGNPGLLSKGISEALITTELGLIVAIPVILFHSLLSSRIDRNIQDLETVGNLLSEESSEKKNCTIC